MKLEKSTVAASTSFMSLLITEGRAASSFREMAIFAMSFEKLSKEPRKEESDILAVVMNADFEPIFPINSIYSNVESFGPFYKYFGDMNVTQFTSTAWNLKNVYGSYSQLCNGQRVSAYNVSLCQDPLDPVNSQNNPANPAPFTTWKVTFDQSLLDEQYQQPLKLVIIAKATFTLQNQPCPQYFPVVPNTSVLMYEYCLPPFIKDPFFDSVGNFQSSAASSNALKISLPIVLVVIFIATISIFFLSRRRKNLQNHPVPPTITQLSQETTGSEFQNTATMESQQSTSSSTQPGFINPVAIDVSTWRLGT